MQQIVPTRQPARISPTIPAKPDSLYTQNAARQRRGARRRARAMNRQLVRGALVASLAGVRAGGMTRGKGEAVAER